MNTAWLSYVGFAAFGVGLLVAAFLMFRNRQFTVGVSLVGVALFPLTVAVAAVLEALDVHLSHAAVGVTFLAELTLANIFGLSLGFRAILGFHTHLNPWVVNPQLTKDHSVLRAGRDLILTIDRHADRITYVLWGLSALVSIGGVIVSRDFLTELITDEAPPASANPKVVTPQYFVDVRYHACMDTWTTRSKCRGSEVEEFCRCMSTMTVPHSCDAQANTVANPSCR